MSSGAEVLLKQLEKKRQQKREKRGKGKQEEAPVRPEQGKEKVEGQSEAVAEPEVKKPKKEILDLSKLQDEEAEVLPRRPPRERKAVVDTRQNLLIIAVAQYQEKGQPRMRSRVQTITSIDESDIRSIFHEFSLLAVEDHQLYFIVQFKSSEDREAAKKKHKMLYKNSLHILMDDYDGAQENPMPRAPPAESDGGSKQGSKYYDNGDGEGDHHQREPQQPLFALGSRAQGVSQPPRPPQRESRSDYRQEHPVQNTMFRLGGNVQPDRPGPAPKPANLPSRRTTTTTPTITKGQNPYGSLQDDD